MLTRFFDELLVWDFTQLNFKWQTHSISHFDSHIFDFLRALYQETEPFAVQSFQLTLLAPTQKLRTNTVVINREREIDNSYPLDILFDQDDIADWNMIKP